MSIVKPKKKAAKSKAVKAALVDGLLSDSATHVHMLLQSQDQQLMSDTMQQLALNPKSIDTFLRVLADLVAKHPQSADRALQWLNRLVETHSGYIVSSPDLTSRLSQLRSQLQLRLASLQRLLMLKGRLDLLLSLHARAATGDSADPKRRGLAASSAVVVHQDTDSEVTEAEDDEDEEDDEGDGDEGPDDLAGQLLGNAESGSEAEMESEVGGSDSEDGEEDEEDAGAIEDEDDDEEVDEDDDEAEDDEEDEGEGEFSSDSGEGDGGAPVGRVR